MTITVYRNAHLFGPGTDSPAIRHSAGIPDAAGAGDSPAPSGSATDPNSFETSVTAEPDHGEQALAVANGRILARGDAETVTRIAGPDAEAVDLDGAFLTPGIVESHAHMLMLGEALDKVALRDCTTVAEVQERLRAAREQNPQATRTSGVGWRFEIFETGQRPTATMLDAVIADVPVILDANDLHSVWVNTAALEAMGITDETPDPVGGEIVRDAAGHATGFLLETAAMQYAWSYARQAASDADRDRFLDNAFTAYLRTGVTAAAEMSFGPTELATYIRRLEREGRLPFPITANWLLTATGNIETDRAQIAEVVAARDEISERFGAQWLQIVGVKFILDGVIDACTAAMREPFVGGEKPDAIWTREFAVPMAMACDAAGLELAMHAIGDDASAIAVDMVEACVRANGPRADRRPRVEHLEYVGDDTIARMAALGVTASMQPVHCDPAILDNWKSVLGRPRAENGFPWHKFRTAGVHLALGTDAPTAPHEVFDNLFIAITARSALDAERAAYHPERVFTPGEALTALTHGGAYATGQEQEFGILAPGARANLVVWRVDPRTSTPDELPGTEAALTLVDGKLAHRG